MKLIQLNIWTGRLLSCVEQFMKDEKPDLLCIQEGIELPGGDGVIFLTNEEIQAAAGLEHTFYSPAYAFNYMRRMAEFGNGIFSKYPLVKTETIFTVSRYNKNGDLKEDDLNIRNLQHAIVKLPGDKKLHLLNHHGYHIGHHKNGDAETLRQCTLIADYAKSLEGPIILTGDFNLAPHSHSIEKINSVLTNLSLKAGLKTTRTALTQKTEVCDYIFVNDLIKVKTFYASDRIISDHKALILEFELS